MSGPWGAGCVKQQLVASKYQSARRQRLGGRANLGFKRRVVTVIKIKKLEGAGWRITGDWLHDWCASDIRSGGKKLGIISMGEKLGITFSNISLVCFRFTYCLRLHPRRVRQCDQHYNNNIAGDFFSAGVADSTTVVGYSVLEFYG